MTIHLKNVMMKQEIQLLFKILMNEFFITDGNHCYNLDSIRKTCNYANTQWNNSNELTSFFTQRGTGEQYPIFYYDTIWDDGFIYIYN